ncbi:MAG: HU family DNA-binding protein [Proteobacteria bacterium]|nr:HU family DNA-binding protein [Pseudomonadota bacterium]
MSKNVTKSELIGMAADATDTTKATTERILNAVLESIESALVAKKNVTLVGFGTFTTSERSAREGRNPKTGDAIKIPAATVPKFRAGKQLKSSVNG